ncbi:hypothetical protein HPB51_027786 [Rhipicephalus microplus]|uniref:Uncharacterized protein n=1 Tax=Rhipicephalus microplus TaxID=6941 RepID=A0A9J6CZ58_RHIMP|nr:hypothetical protein HPB51_027786 [Rhipicephalus microplus]
MLWSSDGVQLRHRSRFCESLYWPDGEILHVRRLGTSNKVRLTFSGKKKPRYASMTPCLSRCSLTKNGASLQSVRLRWASIRRLSRPEIRRLWHLRKDDATHEWRPHPHECTPGTLCVLDRTSPGTGAVGNATGRRHPSHNVLHRKVNPAPRTEKSRCPRKPRKPGSRALPQGAQPSTTNPVTSQHPGAAALGLSRRGPTLDGPQAKRPTAGQGSHDPRKPNPPSPGQKSAGQGIHRGPPAFGRNPGERLRRGSLPVPTLHHLPTQTAYPFRSHLGTN